MFIGPFLYVILRLDGTSERLRVRLNSNLRLDVETWKQPLDMLLSSRWNSFLLCTDWGKRIENDAPPDDPDPYMPLTKKIYICPFKLWNRGIEWLMLRCHCNSIHALTKFVIRQTQVHLMLWDCVNWLVNAWEIFRSLGNKEDPGAIERICMCALYAYITLEAKI